MVALAYGNAKAPVVLTRAKLSQRQGTRGADYGWGQLIHPPGCLRLYVSLLWRAKAAALRWQSDFSVSGHNLTKFPKAARFDPSEGLICDYRRAIMAS